MATIIVKITDGTDIRRFTAQIEDLSFTKLRKRALDAFGPCTSLKLQYQDDENDLITMTSDLEMQEAVGLAMKQEPRILRLIVKTNSKNTTPSATFTAKKATTPLAVTADAATSPPAAAPSGALNLDELLPALGGVLQRMMPHVEIDLTATKAATFAANMANQAAQVAHVVAHDAAARAGAHAPAHNSTHATDHSTAQAPATAGYGDQGAHPGVTCDRSGVCPIVGNRYNLRGRNYDLCEAEFLKLPPDEQAEYVKIPPPNFMAPPASSFGSAVSESPPKGQHVGVTCDRSGMSPISGWRYNLRGANYDLCQDEFDKLPEAEKANYQRISPPQSFWGGRGGHGWGSWHGQGNAAHWNRAARAYCASSKQLGARFVRDVSIFDGTQVAPGTSFTKIWRLKNSGEVPWPAGTRILFVGGDQMSADMSVPITHDGDVKSGDEVDVAVEMIAPTELGRYLGNWRLVGPNMRRRFGQRVWCHIQVVDPAAPPPDMSEIEFEIAMTESKQQSSATDNQDEKHEEYEDVVMVGFPTGPMEGDERFLPSGSSPHDPPAGTLDTAIEATFSGACASLSTTDSASASDAGPSVDPPPFAQPFAQPSAPPQPPLLPPHPLGAKLFEMGFTDAEMVSHVLDKNGPEPDIDDCCRDLGALSKWDHMLDDLAEMGFEDRGMNIKAMLKHNGSIKSAVRELVGTA